MSKAQKEERVRVEEETSATPEKVLRPYIFPEREVSILAESLEEATKIYHSRYPSSV